MPKYESLQDFLQQNGVTGQTTDDRVADLKKKYWKEKRKLYQQIEKERDKRINLTLTAKEYRMVQRAALAKGKRVTPFVKEALLARLGKKPLLHQEDVFLDLIAEINSIGNNINQVVHMMHAIRAYHDVEKYQALVALVRQYQRQIEQHLNDAPDLYTALEQDLMESPNTSERIKQVQQVLDSVQKKGEDDH